MSSKKKLFKEYLWNTRQLFKEKDDEKQIKIKKTYLYFKLQRDNFPNIWKSSCRSTIHQKKKKGKDYEKEMCVLCVFVQISKDHNLVTHLIGNEN